MKEPLISKKFIGSKGDEYIATLYDTFEDCTCPGFKFRRACKHIRKVKKLYNLFNNNNNEKN